MLDCALLILLPKRHSNNPQQQKAHCPIASFNLDVFSNGAIIPAVKADSMVIVNDWQEATVPRMCGNKSSTNNVKPGATIDIPIA